MILVTYDISDDKLRTKFAKFLDQYGRRLQYSVYEIKNSPRILNKVLAELETKYEEKFAVTDSVLIFQMCKGDTKKIQRFGFAAHDEEEVVMF